MSSLWPIQVPRRFLLPPDRTDGPLSAPPYESQRDEPEALPSPCQAAANSRTAGPSFRAELATLVADPVTLLSLRDPYVLGDCGHSFEAQTVAELLRYNELGPVCPLCRTSIESPSLPNFLGRELVDILQRYGVSEPVAPMALRRGPIAPLPLPPRYGAQDADPGPHFCCVAAAYTLAMLGFGISGREENMLRNACALTAWGVGMTSLVAAYAYTVWTPFARREARVRLSA